MKQSNQWVECLNCGNKFSVDTTDYILNDTNCPDCSSIEYIQVEDEHEFIKGTVVKLNESLMEDGEWN